MKSRSFVFCCLAFVISCQKSESAPSGSTPTTSSPVIADSKSDSNSSKPTNSDAKSDDSKSSSEEKKPADTVKPDPVAEPTTALAEAKQTEIKGLLAGNWTSACIKIENPDVPGQFFSSTESWKVAADGTVETTYHDFDDAACQTPSQGFESYVVGIAKAVGVKELGSKHFYIEMNVTKALDNNGTLADANEKYLIMVKFEADGMKVDYAENQTATALSADAIAFTKK